MEENLQPKPENNFIFSKTVRAGKRIYYFDVKKTQTTDSLYITITESKKNTIDDEQKKTSCFYEATTFAVQGGFRQFCRGSQRVFRFY